MATCEKTDSPALSAYLDQALPEQEQQALARHIESCAACAAEIARLGELDAALAGAFEPDLSHDPGAAYWDAFAERALGQALGQSPAPAQAVAAPRRFASFVGGALSAIAGMLLLMTLYEAQFVEKIPVGTTVLALKTAPDSRIEQYQQTIADYQLQIKALERQVVSRKEQLALSRPVQLPGSAVFDGVEVALIQLAHTRSNDQLQTLQLCLAQSQLTRRLKQFCRSVSAPLRVDVDAICLALDQVGLLSAGRCDELDIDKLREKAQREQLQQRLARLRRLRHDNLREVKFASR